MQLVALLVAVLIAGVVVVSRYGPGLLPSPARKEPLPSQTLQEVKQQVDAASQADQQRLDDALKQLR